MAGNSPFKPTFTRDLEQLRATFERERNEGTVTFAVEPRLVDPALWTTDDLDAYVTRLGLRPLGSSWRHINRTQAKNILQSTLRRDMAYNSQIMSAVRARELATRFVDLLAPRAQLFTNGTFRVALDSNGRVRSRLAIWSTLTFATFDTGVLYYDAGRIGLLWFGDED